MNILEEIALRKRKDVSRRKELVPVRKLETSIYFPTECVSLRTYLRREEQHGIIAEFKRASPSRGVFNAYADPRKICLGYMQAGATALSILTDEPYFHGKDEDLTVAREWNYCPILRKDFIVDAYQIIEAKSIGADVILLIASLLSRQELREYTRLAHDLGLEVLVEIHEPAELCEEIKEADLLGVNSRSLKRMQVLPEHHAQCLPHLPAHPVKIAESGLRSPQDVAELRDMGYHGFLIGSHFMEHPDPAHACRTFLESLDELQKKATV